MRSRFTGQGGRSRALLPVLALTAALLTVPDAALAETLNEALVSAYSGNPTLRAQRAQQRSTDEVVPQALSGWRPTVTAQALAGVENVQDHNNGPQAQSPGTNIPG